MSGKDVYRIKLAVLKELNKIKNICSLNLDLYHQPFSIESIDSFPITNLGENIGKVDYKKLEENANETVKVKKLVK